MKDFWGKAIRSRRSSSRHLVNLNFDFIRCNFNVGLEVLAKETLAPFPDGIDSLKFFRIGLNHSLRNPFLQKCVPIRHPRRSREDDWQARSLGALVSPTSNAAPPL